MNADKCACCGAIIPEGTQVCITCLNGCAERGWEDKDNCKACRMRNKLKRREIKLMAETDLNYVRDIENELKEYLDTGLTIKDVKELKADCNYWEREAKKWCNKLGEIRGMVERSEL